MIVVSTVYAELPKRQLPNRGCGTSRRDCNEELIVLWIEQARPGSALRANANAIMRRRFTNEFNRSFAAHNNDASGVEI